MTSRPDEPQRALEQLLVLARGELDERPPVRGEARYEGVVEQLRVRRRRRPLVALACVATVVALGLAVRSTWNGPEPSASSSAAAPSPLAVQITGGTLDASGQVNSRSNAVVRFSDGTRVKVEAGALLQVEALTPHGADLRLRRGELKLDVVQREAARWRVLAGEYEIRVTGTSFRVQLSEGKELSVALDEGSVVVRGPLALAGVEVEAGQLLRVHPPNGTVELEPLESSSGDAISGDAGATARAPAELRPTPKPVQREAAPRKPRLRDADWPSRVASGDWASVLAEATRYGLSKTHGEASLEGLQALADAARYDRRFALARGTLLSIRRRFPRHPWAARSAFHLGRLAENESNTRQALTWYDRYLAEEAAGPYAEQALGRKLQLVVRSKPGDARSVAREYLRRFPRGTHAETASRHAGAGGGAKP